MNALEIAAYVFGLRLSQAVVICDPKEDCSPAVVVRVVGGLINAWTRLATVLRIAELDRRAVETVLFSALNTPRGRDHHGYVEYEQVLELQQLIGSLRQLVPPLLPSGSGETRTRTAYDLGVGILQLEIAQPSPSIPAIQQQERPSRFEHPSGIRLAEATEQQLAELGVLRSAVLPDGAGAPPPGWSQLGWAYEPWDVLESGVSAILDSDEANTTQLSASERLNKEAYSMFQTTNLTLREIAKRISDGEQRSPQRIHQMARAHAELHGIQLRKRQSGRPPKNKSRSD